MQTLCFKSHLAFFACMVGEGIYIYSYILTFFLAFCLAFSLACVQAQAWPTASGADDMEFGSRRGPRSWLPKSWHRIGACRNFLPDLSSEDQLFLCCLEGPGRLTDQCACVMLVSCLNLCHLTSAMCKAKQKALSQQHRKNNAVYHMFQLTVNLCWKQYDLGSSHGGTLLSTALIPQNFTDSTRMRVTVLKQKVLLPSATFIPGFHSLGSQPGFGRLQALPWHSSSLSLMIHWFKTIHWIYINWQCHFHDGAALSGQLSQSRVLLWWVNTGLHPRHVLIGFREPPCHQQHGVGHRAYKGTVATS